MQATDFKKKKEKTPVIKRFPKQHLIIAGLLACALTFTLTLFPSKDVSAKRQEMVIELPILTEQEQTEQIALAQEEPVVEEEFSWTELRVKNGDNLSLIFKRAGLNDGDIYELFKKSKEATNLKQIHPGHKLAFQLDDAGKLVQLRYTKDRLNSQLFYRTESGFDDVKETRKPDAETAFRSATIKTSLFVAGQEANMEDSLIMELASIFGWDIDFALDIREGDSFRVSYEEYFLDGEKLGNGPILAATFVNQNQEFNAVRYTDSDGESQYYTPDGHAMRKAFLRAPLDFNRISSGFNPNRLHPIRKTRRPHRGTDYAAKRGTPIYASGSGRVITSTYNKASGNYIVIQHGNNIQTKYLHLTKRKVRVGQKVKQKQIIGTLGSTGLATGPHLHYEFLVSGVHRNPRTILQKLPKAKSIPKSDLAIFAAQTQPLIARLNKFQQSTQLALVDSEADEAQ